jgi:hypothetical protein
MIEAIRAPYRIQTKLEKRRESDAEPYETLTTSTWYEADGAEITDQERIDQLEAEQRQKGT